MEEKLLSQKNKISEMSAETIWQDGKIIYFNCVDRIFPRDDIGLKNFQNFYIQIINQVMKLAISIHP